MPYRIDVHLFEAHGRGDLELRTVGREIGRQVRIGRLRGQRVVAEELHLLFHAIADDRVVAVETHGQAFAEEHLVPDVVVHERLHLRLTRRAVPGGGELRFDGPERVRGHDNVRRAWRCAANDAVGGKERRAQHQEVQERLSKQPANHFLYQIGDVNARSCVVIGTLASIFTLKYAAS